MRTCLFCDNPGNSREHYIPAWVLQRYSPTTEGLFPVKVGNYREGKGYLVEREFDSQNATAKVVCENCNNGWMAKLEVEIEMILGPLLERRFPECSSDAFEELKVNAERIALWMSKTALLVSCGIQSADRLTQLSAQDICSGQVPHGVFLDVATSKRIGIDAAISRTFPILNGRRTSIQTHTQGGSFQFCIQINHLLLRIGMAKAAYVFFIGSRDDPASSTFPFPLYPRQSEVPRNFEFEDFNHFFFSMGLQTWLGCEGEAP